MGRDNDNYFEEGLREIMDPGGGGPPDGERARPGDEAGSPPGHQGPPPESKAQKIPAAVETAIRIAAAVIVLALLLLFGMQIAFR